MPEPNQNIPILEGFLTGGPISEHDGVSCSPAMREATEEKYILKAISVPASEAKLEAMLLAGAFSNKEAALAYYQDMAHDIAEEAALLQQLSRLEGFAAYENWQVSPKDDTDGFCVYLLSPYRLTLERHLRSNPITHLDAVNLGLDLCAALAVCRRSGYLYVDLKPSNIYICDDREFRIGDLGFIALASLPYASLPEKYHSAYTAPEIADAYSALNGTLDIYAAGLILYQVYNNGVLPQTDGDTLLPPEYADYEMASIILKACDPNPDNRWQDPAEMGQALVAYMQKNTVNDTPIVPPAIPVEVEPEAEEAVETTDSDEPTTDEVINEVDQALESVGVDLQQAEAELLTSADVEKTAAEAEEEDAEESAEDITGDSAEEVPAEDTGDVTEEALEAEAASEDAPAADAEKNTEPTPQTEEAPKQEEEVTPATEENITEEVSQMLAQADDLIAHETPDPVVAPEPIDVPIPPKIVLPAEEELEEPEITEEEVTENAEEILEETSEEMSDEAIEAEPLNAETAQETAEEEAEDEEAIPEKPTRRSPLKALIAAAISLAIAAGLFLGGYFYYHYEYLQHIENISLSGNEDRLTVSLITDIEDSLLTVVCTDTYGNTKRQSVTDKTAVFTGLNPDTRYKVQVEIDGFHQLTGTTSGIHITQAQTSILNFSCVSGAENGSVILSFTVHGPDSKEWRIKYHALGEEAQSVTFTGHVVTINGLALGKKYTFWLEPMESLYTVGADTLEFTVSKLIFAENLVIQGFSGSALTATWSAPEGETVDSWIVRCYNEFGFDKTITVNGTTAVFEQLDPAHAYTVEVTAVGMTQGRKVSVSANSLTIQNLSVDVSDPERLKLHWTFTGKAPAGGWLLQYAVRDTSDSLTVNCPTSNAEITPVVPGGVYFFTIQSADGNTVFNSKWAFTAPLAENNSND